MNSQVIVRSEQAQPRTTAGIFCFATICTIGLSVIVSEGAFASKHSKRSGATHSPSHSTRSSSHNPRKSASKNSHSHKSNVSKKSEAKKSATELEAKKLDAKPIGSKSDSIQPVAHNPVNNPQHDQNSFSGSRSGYVNRAVALNNSSSPESMGTALPSRGMYITRTAQQFKGWPYVWGGTSPNSGFDCSGLVQYVYKKWGILLPRCASDQVHQGVPVAFADLQAGDLVFFKNTYKSGLSHVGIYVGKGWFIHAASSRTGVVMSRIDRGYHKEHYLTARRLNLSKLPPAPGEEYYNGLITIEDPVVGDPLPAPVDIDPQDK